MAFACGGYLQVRAGLDVPLQGRAIIAHGSPTAHSGTADPCPGGRCGRQIFQFAFREASVSRQRHVNFLKPFFFFCLSLHPTQHFQHSISSQKSPFSLSSIAPTVPSFLLSTLLYCRILITGLSDQDAVVAPVPSCKLCSCPCPCPCPRPHPATHPSSSLMFLISCLRNN